MAQIEDVFDIIERSKEPADFVGPVPEEMIQQAESRLGVRFPPSYRCFVKRYGSLGIGAQEFFGITASLDAPRAPNVVWYTIEQRRSGLPKHFIVIQDLGEEVKYCLDTSKVAEDGEAPVVKWDEELSPEEQNLTPVSPNFADFAYSKLARYRG